VPVHIVTTDLISGDSIRVVGGLDLAGDRRLDRNSRRVRADPLQGLLSRRRRVSSNTPIQVAVRKGAGG